MRLALSAFLLLLLTGCVSGHYNVARTGPYLREEQYAFLREPDANRAEVRATLGPPTASLPDGSVFAYLWKEAHLLELAVGFSTSRELHTFEISPERRGLFIQFASDGSILQHSVWGFPLDVTSENACALWLARANQSLPVSGSQ